MAWLLMTMLVLPVSGECCHEKKQIERLKCLFFYVVCNHFRFEIIFVSITPVLLSLVCYHFRLYFVSVLLIISVSVFVSVNEIFSFSLSVSVSVNEYITAGNQECAC